MKFRKIRYYIFKFQRLLWQMLDTLDRKLGPGPSDHR